MDPPGPEQAHAVAVQAVRPVCVERLADRLERRTHLHLRQGRKEARQQPADLVGAPAALEVVGNDPPELEIPPEFPLPWADPSAAAARPWARYG